MGATAYVLPDKLKVIGLLGRGGMGEVLLARDRSRGGGEVAVKVLRDGIGDPEAVEKRFRREALNMLALDHPGIVRAYYTALEDEAPFLVMEYLKGPTFAEALKERKCATSRPFPFEEAVAYLAPVAEALAYVHDQGFAHRDVKPANILHAARGPVLMDFGIAKAEDATALTASGVVCGSPHYLAPEVVRGEVKDVEGFRRGDVWSLGVTAFELLTGRVPFEGDQGLAVAIAISTATEAPRLRNLAPWLGTAQEDAVRRALHPDPRRRHPNARAFADALGVAAGKEETWVAPTPDPRPWNPSPPAALDGSPERLGASMEESSSPASSFDGRAESTIEHSEPVVDDFASVLVRHMRGRSGRLGAAAVAAAALVIAGLAGLAWRAWREARDTTPHSAAEEDRAALPAGGAAPLDDAAPRSAPPPRGTPYRAEAVESVQGDPPVASASGRPAAASRDPAAHKRDAPEPQDRRIRPQPTSAAPRVPSRRAKTGQGRGPARVARADDEAGSGNGRAGPKQVPTLDEARAAEARAMGLVDRGQYDAAERACLRFLDRGPSGPAKERITHYLGIVRSLKSALSVPAPAGPGR